MLDEPTNHLDLPARQVLEEILRTYDGTMIFVSHDRYFVDALATKLWLLGNGAVEVFDGNYTRYRLRQTRPEVGRPEEPGARRGVGVSSREPLSPAARTVAMVETEISGLEARMTQLENQLGEASSDSNILRINELADEYEKVKATLQSLYEEWEEVAG